MTAPSQISVVQRAGWLAAALLLAPLASAAAQSGPPPTVIVESVREARFVTQVEALGTLRPNARVEITALVTEQVDTLHVDDGVRVERGDRLVDLRHIQEDALLEEALATKAEAEELLDDAQRLFATGSGSEALLTERRRAAAVAAARVKAAEAQIADRVITAPFAGRIGIRSLSPGATVEPGDLILRLIDDSILKLDFSVPSLFLADLAVGSEIEARSRAFPDEVFRGRIASIDAEADPVTRSVLVRAFIPNEERRLLPGLLMEVELALKAREALVVSEESLIPFGEDTFVLVAAEREGAMRVERRKVRTGGRRIGEVEVLEGLSDGERVVVEGGIKVRPGQAVTIREAVTEESLSPGDETAARPASIRTGG
ncbi:MAG: efflux RND transporter periplasmic adaptor subunit [Pseudomonadota bacterium]